MKSNYKKLGDYIRPVNIRNRDLSINNVYGVNLTKNFFKTIANIKDVDLSVYKIVKKGQFGCKLMSVGRDNRLPIGYWNKNENIIISPAYHVFEIIDKSILLPEYLFMWLFRGENDRRLGFNSAGDVRGGVSWEEFCEIEIPIPDIEVQKNVVAVYNELLRNQKSYEGSLDDLQLICDTFIEDLAKENDLKRLGDYVEKITAKNTDDKLKSLVGISERKEFRTPSGKVNKENLSNHLIVNWGEFAYIPRMNPFKPLAIAVSFFEYPILVSPSYVAFKIIDTDILLPEFLLLFFKRTEFDRYAAYNAWSSTRDTFNWEDMCEVKLSIPDIEVQKSIVAIHHVLESRKKLNEDLKNMITSLCPVLMKGVVDTLTTK